MIDISFSIPDAFIIQTALVLLHFCWQGVIVGVVCWLVLWTLQDQVDGSATRARHRYWVCSVALLLMAALPIANYGWVPAPTLTSDTLFALPLLPSELEGDGGPEVTATTQSASAKPATESVPGDAAEARVVDSTPSWFAISEWRQTNVLLRFTFWVWLCGVIWMSAWHVMGWWVARKYGRDGTDVPDFVLSSVRQVARRLGIERTIRVRQTCAIGGPAVMGILRPVLLLPASVISGLTVAELEALLAHELAHVKRFDYVMNLVQSVVESMLFYHPAVWLVSRRLRVEREYCADDLALQVCRRDLYVRTLVNVAELAQPRPQHALAATDGHLLSRVRRLLPVESATHHVSWQRRSALVGLLLIACMAATLTAVAQRPQVSENEVVDTASKPSGPPSLSGLVKVLNNEAAEHPESRHTEPISVNAILQQLADLNPHPRLADEDFQQLKQLRSDSPLPENMSLRQLVRYYTPEGMRHGRWVRLLVEGSGTFLMNISDEVAFERPFTLMERMAVAEVAQRQGFLTLGRFISFLDQDPKLDEPTSWEHNNESFLTAVRQSLARQDADALFDLFLSDGFPNDDPQRTFMLREIRQAMAGTVLNVELVRKPYDGQPKHWQGSRTFRPNVPVAGYLRITTNREAVTRVADFEVGYEQDSLRFVAYIIDEDHTKDIIGKPLSSPITSRHFIGELDGGWLEFGTSVEVPNELRLLAQANLELWKLRPDRDDSSGETRRIAAIIDGLERTEAAIKNLSVTTEYVKTQRFGLPVDEPVRMRLTTKAVVEPGGRAWNETRGQQVNVEPDGKTVRLYDEAVKGAFYDNTARRLRGNELTLSDHLTWHGMDPLLFTTHYFSHPVSALMRNKGAHLVEESTWDGRTVVVVDTTPTKVFRKYRFWIDPERNIVVRRAALVQFERDQPYQEYTRIEGYQHREVTPGVWLPMRIKYESVEVTADQTPEVLSWRFEGTNRDWSVNRTLVDADFAIPTLPSYKVRDRRQQKPDTSPTDSSGTPN